MVWRRNLTRSQRTIRNRNKKDQKKNKTKKKDEKWLRGIHLIFFRSASCRTFPHPRFFISFFSSGLRALATLNHFFFFNVRRRRRFFSFLLFNLPRPSITTWAHIRWNNEIMMMMVGAILGRTLTQDLMVPGGGKRKKDASTCFCIAWKWYRNSSRNKKKIHFERDTKKGRVN